VKPFRFKLHVAGFSAALLVVSVTPAQEPSNSATPGETPEKPIEFICPMDPDVRSKGPARCPRCGMKLEPGIPAAVEYPVVLHTRPKVVRAGQKAWLTFEVRDPKSGKPVTDFEVMHEKLFHLFLVSEDLQFFAHEHPEQGADGRFQYEVLLPKPGHYRLLADFFPKGGTPQLAAKSLITAGAGALGTAQLAPDLAPKQGPNLTVSLASEPEQPIAGLKTLLFFRLKNAEGLEPYLGALGHMLATSSDLVDMIHAHPAFPETWDRGGERQVQFNVIFPREGVHRIWVQFQNNGVVNTVAFNVPVTKLK
jgi:hypothetical protein